MKVLIIGLNYEPELMGVGKYSGEMARWLAAKAHNVHVITSFPHYPAWRVSAPYVGCFYKIESVAGVDLTRTWAWVPRKPSGLKRLLHAFSFALSSSFAVIRQTLKKPDVMLVVEPSLSCAPLALLMARLTKTQCWLHVQDLEVDAALKLDIFKSQLLASFALSMERFLIRRFDVVSTITPEMMSNLQAKGVAADRLRYFPNWVNTDFIHPHAGLESEEYGRIRTEAGIASEQTVCLYSGNFGEKQGLDTILETARLLCARKDIVFVLCGNGAVKSRLMESAAALSNIRWLDAQPLHALPALLCIADVHLLPQRADASGLVFPSKLTGMFASGRPVVAEAVPGSDLYALVEPRGAVVPPGAPDQFAEALLRLVDDVSLRNRLGALSRAYAVTHMDARSVLTGFERDLQSLVRSVARPRD